MEQTAKDKANSETKPVVEPPKAPAVPVQVQPQPATLSTQDLMYLIGVIRRVKPDDFDDGKQLTFAEAKLLQVIQESQRLQANANALPPGITPIPGVM